MDHTDPSLILSMTQDELDDLRASALAEAQHDWDLVNQLGIWEIVMNSSSVEEAKEKVKDLFYSLFHEVLSSSINSMIDSDIEAAAHSKQAHEEHLSSTAIDFNEIEPIRYPHTFDLAPEEIRFLSKVNGKSDLSEIPQYFTYEYHMDYKKVLGRLFGYGLLEISDASYDLQKLTIPQLKELLSDNGITPKGKKGDLISLALGNLSSDVLSSLPHHLITTEEGNLLLKDCEALLIFYNGFSNASWATPADILTELSINPGQDPYEILKHFIQLENRRLESKLASNTQDIDTLTLWQKNNPRGA